MTNEISYTVRLASDPERFAFSYPTLEDAKSAVAYHQSNGEWQDASIYRKTETVEIDPLTGFGFAAAPASYEGVAL